MSAQWASNDQKEELLSFFIMEVNALMITLENNGEQLGQSCVIPK